MISTIDSDKSTLQNINYTTNSSDHFQDLYSNCNCLFYLNIIKCSIIPNDNFTVNKTNSDILKISCDSHNLKEHLDVLNSTDIDVTGENYSNSTAIKILDDVAKSPVDKNVSYPLINIQIILE